ncbi:hypothetical protein C5167_010517 [Papaver somniferum]|uniref:Uncharacterized protein n=1 Tax=Papaver somniferum TaxID=3469 RepID=A0A4Y7K4B2_PAPSO|nr:hypothetical protein C5167_010517 [Papaver somniferum]
MGCSHASIKDSRIKDERKENKEEYIKEKKTECGEQQLIMDRDLDYAIKHLARNGVLIDFHDMKPIEGRLIVTDLGKKKYVDTPEKGRKMTDRIYLSLHYGPEWKQKHKIVVRAPHWIHMLLINTFIFANVVKKMYT